MGVQSAVLSSGHGVQIPLVCLNRAAAQAATQTDLLFRTNLRIFVSSDEVHRCESYDLLFRKPHGNNGIVVGLP